MLCLVAAVDRGDTDQQHPLGLCWICGPTDPTAETISRVLWIEQVGAAHVRSEWFPRATVEDQSSVMTLHG